MSQQLKSVFPSITQKQLEQFDMFEKLFIDWNSKINLVSRKDTDHLLVRHILHSLSIAKVFSFDNGTNIIDIGTGGGFPGIPLAIMFPYVNFDLVDSIGKKIMVVDDIAEKLNLTNVKAIKSRAENMPAKYDFIISRAVTAFPDFVKITENLFRKPNSKSLKGIIYLKGGDFSDEIKGFSACKLYNIRDIFDDEFFETKKIIFLPKKF